MRKDSTPQSASPRAADPKLPWEVWALLVGSFLVAVGYGVVAPALPAFARSFGVGVTAAAAAVSALPVLRLLFAPVSGRLVGRLGERTMYLTGLLVVAASTGACAVATSYVQLLVFRGLGGIGSTLFTVSAFSLLFRLAPPECRGHASGLFTGAFLLGGVSGPALGGALVAVDLRAPFVVYALGLVVTTLVVGALLLRSRQVGVRRDPADDQPMAFRAALALPAYRAAMVSSVATGWAIQGVRVALVPLFVTEVLHRTSVWGGVALTVFAIGDGAVLLATSGLSDRRGRRPVIIAGLLLVTVGTVALGLLPFLPALLLASLVAGTGTGLLQPAQGASVGDVVGSGRSGGRVLSGFQMATDLGAVLGPVVTGAIAENSSYAVAFAVSGAIAAVALVAWVRVPGGARGAAVPGGGSAPSASGTRPP